MLLRAIVNLDPYTFADDLAEDIAAEDEKRSAEEVLLATIADTEDDKRTRFALRLALSGHIGIPRENEFDSLQKPKPLLHPLSPRKPSQRRPTNPRWSRHPQRKPSQPGSRLQPNPGGGRTGPLAFTHAESGAVMDRTEHTIRQLLAALPPPATMSASSPSEACTA